MEYVEYVNKTGKLINNSTKYSVDLDRTSIANLVIYSHLNEVMKWLSTTKEFSQEEKLEITPKISNYILCLKKQINFYPEKVIDPNCILTEIEEHIIQE